MLMFTIPTNHTNHRDPNVGSPETNPQADSKPKENSTQDVEKAHDATPKLPATDYPSGINLIILFVGLFLAALCVGLVRVPISIPPIASVLLLNRIAYLLIRYLQDRTIVATAIPKITSDFNSLDDVGWYGSAYLLTNCCFQLFFGKLYAEFPVKWVFLTALFIFEVGSIVCATAPSSVALIVGRAVAGIGGAGIVSGTLIVSSNHCSTLIVAFRFTSLLTCNNKSRFSRDVSHCINVRNTQVPWVALWVSLKSLRPHLEASSLTKSLGVSKKSSRSFRTSN